jgi:hypothetical protein
MGRECGTFDGETWIYGVGGETWKRPHLRLRQRYEDNTEMGLYEIGLQGVAWTDIFQDRDKWWAFVNTEMNFHKMQ